MPPEPQCASRVWYLVYAKPRNEWRALENLERQGYEAYLPLMRNRRRRQGRYVTTVEPMFPRYLFVHLDRWNDNWAPIRSTFGVSQIVQFGETPARVPDELIEALRAREDDEGVQSLPAPTFERGQQVRIVEGAMAGYEAIFWAQTSNERVTLLLQIAGSEAKLDVRAGQIEPAS